MSRKTIRRPVLDKLDDQAPPEFVRRPLALPDPARVGAVTTATLVQEREPGRWCWHVERSPMAACSARMARSRHLVRYHRRALLLAGVVCASSTPCNKRAFHTSACSLPPPTGPKSGSSAHPGSGCYPVPPAAMPTISAAPADRGVQTAACCSEDMRLGQRRRHASAASQNSASRLPCFCHWRRSQASPASESPA